jgi:hypothetical protein
MNLMANRFLDEVFLTEQPSGSVLNVVYQEEIDPPEDTTMKIWDPDLIMPFDDLFESQETPAEVSVVQTHSKGPPASKYPITTQMLGERSTPNHLKTPFSPCKNPINIHTRELPKLNYNVVEDSKKLKDNISVMDICRIPQQKDFLRQDLRSVENPMTSNDQQRNLTPIDLGNKLTLNTFSKDKKGRPFVPPFLLKFEVFNRNLHNCLVYSGASSNFMPLSICKKLNIVPLKSDKHVIQLDITQVKVMGEIKYVIIRIATHPKFVQVIDIIIVDILEAYGLLLS